MEKMWENLNYIILIGLILGQIFIGTNFILGESIYILTDIFILSRDFGLKRPVSDKVKNGTLTAFAMCSLLINMR